LEVVLGRAIGVAVKPRLRGVSHLVAFFVALVFGARLAMATAPGTARTAALVYAASLAALFGISALYHVPMWTPRPRAFLRRCDHAAILLLIAGTYTPICLRAPGLAHPEALLVAVWTGAALGIGAELLWPGKPRWVTAATCVLLGWALLSEGGALVAGLGPGGMTLAGGGGALYTLGAVVYSLKRPNPFPTVFGYHEIFHALVIAAAVLHFMLVRNLVLR
jgi:hemolysin III